MTGTKRRTAVSTRSGGVGRWLALLGGVVNPVAFVVTYTVAGALRPGYSPIRQPISDLGAGRHGPLMDTIAVARGLPLTVFAAGFAMVMRPVPGAGWRRLATTLLVLRGLANVATGLFTDAPATVAIHSVATVIALLSVVLAFLVTGRVLRRDARWRRWGSYSLAATAASVLLAAVEFWLFNPRSPAAPTRLGGLAERVVNIETLAWWVVPGWRLFREGQRARHPAPTGITAPTYR